MNLTPPPPSLLCCIHHTNTHFYFTVFFLLFLDCSSFPHTSVLLFSAPSPLPSQVTSCPDAALYCSSGKLSAQSDWLAPKPERHVLRPLTLSYWMTDSLIPFMAFSTIKHHSLTNKNTLFSTIFDLLMFCILPWPYFCIQMLFHKLKNQRYTTATYFIYLFI